ncbi:response regulator, partial [Oleiphilus sp. HI0061]
KESPDSLVTVSVDSTLLYELESMESQLPDPLKNHKTVLMTDKDECSEIKDPSFSGRFRISFLSQPLRYDELLAEITCHDGSHESDNIKLDNVQHGEDLGFAPHSKILVVEDNKVNQQVLMIMLDYLNLKADIANDGVEALEAVQKSHYDLILMDWQMPRMDGLEATRNIRAIQGLVQPAIIAVTANAMSGDIEKCIEAGMDDYLSKPVEKDKLEQTIRRWLAPKHDEQVS